MEINEEVMRNGFRIYKQSHHRGDFDYNKFSEFYSYMMTLGEGDSVCYKLCDQDMEPDEMVSLNGVELRASENDKLVRDFYLVAEYNSWVLRGWFQNVERVYPRGNDVEFVEFNGVRLRRYQLDEISRQYAGNMMKYFKKFVLGPVRIDRRHTNGSSLYVQIYPENYVLKMSRLVADLQIRRVFNAKTRKRYSTDRVYALNLLKQFLPSYWHVITDEAKCELRESIVGISNEEFVDIQVRVAARDLIKMINDAWLQDVVEDVVVRTFAYFLIAVFLVCQMKLFFRNVTNARSGELWLWLKVIGHHLLSDELWIWLKVICYTLLLLLISELLVMVTADDRSLNQIYKALRAAFTPYCCCSLVSYWSWPLLMIVH